MFIWHKIRGAKQAAVQHQQSTSEQQQQPVALNEQPYRHIPTHARQDALHAMPGATKEETRRRIKEQHQIRTAMGLDVELNRTSYRHFPVRPYHPAPAYGTYGQAEAGPSGTYSAGPSRLPDGARAAGSPYENRSQHNTAPSSIDGLSRKDLVGDASGIVGSASRRSSFSHHQSFIPVATHRLHSKGPPTENSLDMSHDGTEPSLPDTAKSSHTSVSSQAQQRELEPDPKTHKDQHQQELYEMLVKRA